MRTVIIGEHALGTWVVINAVRPLANVDFLDELQGRWIKHRNLVFPAITGESVPEIGCNRDPMDAWRIGDSTHELAAVRIQDVDLGRM